MEIDIIISNMKTHIVEFFTDRDTHGEPLQGDVRSSVAFTQNFTMEYRRLVIRSAPKH